MTSAETGPEAATDSDLHVILAVADVKFGQGDGINKTFITHCYLPNTQL
jgi:hypothetical protein